jgi:hypothetical protein
VTTGMPLATASLIGPSSTLKSAMVTMMPSTPAAER